MADPEDAGVPPICAAIRELRIAMGMSQEALAAGIGAKQATITRLESTQIPSLSQVVALEDHFEVPRGELLRRGGYVFDPSTPRDVIAVDVRLDPTARQAVLAVYDRFADPDEHHSKVSSGR